MKKMNHSFREILLPFVGLHSVIAVFVALVYIVGFDKIMFAFK